MPYRRLLIMILGVIAILTAAAIAFLPDTLYFPVVEYWASENIQVVILKNGEPDKSRCEQSVSVIVASLRGSCANCKYVERCIRGLDAERRKILSREPLSIPSMRTPSDRLTTTIFAKDPQLALSVCRLTEEQTASQTEDKRLHCFPASAPR